ncbi:MAG: HdeD family acid-resistance protein [Thermoanaerobaculia bacterium]|nr:HdeD family acid-resistance protein [Thermoanaerobaculia bacterium]
MTTDTLSKEVSKHAGWSIFMGFLTAAVGAAMIFYPLATATASTVFLGAALFVASVAQLIFAFTSPTPGQFFLKLLLGILYGVAGLCLIALPGMGVVTLTAVLGAMLIAEAVVETILGFSAPKGAGRGWFFLSGFFSLLLGILILAQWPVSSIWAIGTMVGAGVLFSGITRIVTSSWVRSEAREFQRSTAAA